MARRARWLTHVAVAFLILSSTGCALRKTDVDPYRPPASARESCEQLVRSRLPGRVPVDVFNREVERCLNEYAGIFRAGDPDLTVRRSSCARRGTSADIAITVYAVNTHAGRNLEFWVELRNGQFVQTGTGTQLGTFPTLRYRVPPGTPFPQDTSVALPVGTVTLPSGAAFPVDVGFEVVVDADNEYGEANEYDNVRPSGCSNVP